MRAAYKYMYTGSTPTVAEEGPTQMLNQKQNHLALAAVVHRVDGIHESKSLRWT